MYTKKIRILPNEIYFISALHYRFPRGVSASDVMISLTSLLFKDINNEFHIFSVYIDLRKAFETVYHTVLLTSLRNYYPGDKIRNFQDLFNKSPAVCSFE